MVGYYDFICSHCMWTSPVCPALFSEVSSMICGIERVIDRVAEYILAAELFFFWFSELCPQKW